jgi:hypothetical protein
VRDGRVRIQLDAAAMSDQTRGAGRRGAGSFGNFLDVRGSVLKPDGSTEEITLDQVGPGRYRSDALADQTGNYVVSLFIQEPDGTRRAVFGGAGKPPGQELRRFKSNASLLKQIAQITNGRILDPFAPTTAGLFARTQSFETRSVRPLWRTLLWWLVVAFMLDVACRRIAWDPAAMWAWCRQRVDAVLAAMRPREVEAGATLSALKSRQAQTERELDARASGAKPVAVPMIPPPSKRQKFQADANFTAQDDFTSAVGGAGEDTPTPDTNKDGAGAGEHDDTADQGPTTSRLLEAKRRAREELENE